MEHFNSLSYDYYNKFYSYKGYFRKLLFNLTAAFISAILFALVFIDFSLLTFFGEHMITWENINPMGLEINPKDQNSLGLGKKYSMALLFTSETIFILSFLRLNFLKEQLIKKSFSNNEEITKKSISDFQKLWLLKTINKKPHEYIAFTDSIIKSYDIFNEIEQPFEFNRTRIYHMIYQKSAKPRILTFMIALMSIFSVMILKTPNSLDVIFGEIYQTSTGTIIILIVVYTLLLKSTLFTIKYIALIFITLMDAFSVYIDRPHKANSHVTKILIRDLIKYSRIELKTPNDITLSS